MADPLTTVQGPHLWSFNDAGRVVRFRHYLDTAKHIWAAGRA